jgi:hypothetical protein
MDKLEERLVRDRLISEEQLALAYQEAKHLKKTIWAALVKMDILTEEQIALFFSEELGIAYVRPNDYVIDEGLMEVVEEDYCRENMLIPLFKIDNLLYVAMANPLDTTVLDGLSSRAGCIIEPLVAAPGAILQAIDNTHGIKDRFSFLQKLILRQKPLQALPFSREAERIPLSIPVKLKVESEELVLRSKVAVDGLTKDISSGGTAVGLEIFLFLPKGSAVSMDFQQDPSVFSSPKGITAKGEVVYCRMEKGRQYFLGIKFTQVDKEALVSLMKEARGQG